MFIFTTLLNFLPSRILFGVLGHPQQKEGGLVKKRLSWMDIPIHEDGIKGSFLFHILTAVRLAIFSLNIQHLDADLTIRAKGIMFKLPLVKEKS